MNADEREKLFLEKVRKELDAAAGELDGETLARLRQARLKAVEEAGRRRWWPLVPKWVTAGGLATAMVLVVAVSVWFNASKERLPVRQAEDVEILAAQENMDISRDLEFYRWLAAADNER
jgi:type VI protein secretion system component VasF